MSGIVLYHGSGTIIDVPSCNKGRVYNDFGKGFYCTEHLPLAKEWASVYGNDACVNEYSLDVNNLIIADLTSCSYSILHWVALVADNRRFFVHDDLKEKLSRFSAKYIKDLESADIIIGCRGDDSYFSYFKDFINDRISYDCLKYVLENDEQNVQIVLKSKKAFDAVELVSHERVDCVEHVAHRKTRDNNLINIVENKKEEFANGKYFSDFVL